MPFEMCLDSYLTGHALRMLNDREKAYQRGVLEFFKEMLSLIWLSSSGSEGLGTNFEAGGI